MCDWRQRCLGGVPHYSKESSLHSCSVCGNPGAELLEHWLSSQQDMEKQPSALPAALAPHVPGVAESRVSGSAGGCAALRRPGSCWRVGTAPSWSGAPPPALAQRAQDSTKVVTPTWVSRVPQGSGWHRFASPA